MNCHARDSFSYDFSRSARINLCIVALGIHSVMKSRASSLLSYEFPFSGIIEVWDFALGAYSDMSFCARSLSSHEFSPLGAYSVMGFRSGLPKLSKLLLSGLLNLSVTRVLSVYSFSRLGFSLSGP